MTTGAEVIESLSFDGHTVSYPVFGLGMLLIGFLIIAFFILDKSKLNFLPLGHTGTAYVRALGLPELAITESVKASPESEIEMQEGKFAAKNWDIENNVIIKSVAVGETPPKNENFSGESKNAII